MHVITTDLLRRALGPNVASLTYETIKVGASPSQIHRVFPIYKRATGPESLIVKTIASVWPGDAFGGDRELRFYREMSPLLDLPFPRLYSASVDRSTTMRVIVMEDLAPRYRFFRPEHIWTPPQARCLLRAYARLHSEGSKVLGGEPPPEWLFPAYDARLRGRAIPGLARAITARGLWGDLPGLDEMFERVLRDLGQLGGSPVTLLHNDVYPPNLAFPRETGGEGVLIDWEMVGSGLAELDLAYMFLQPYRSHQALDRQGMLTYYWEQRALLGDMVPSLGDRCDRQLLADRIMALWLIPVAHKVALMPYPLGSAPGSYWQHMFSMLYERLLALVKGEWC